MRPFLVIALVLVLARQAGACPPEALGDFAPRPQPYTGGDTEVSQSNFDGQIVSNVIWPFANTYIRIGHIQRIIEANPTEPQFQLFGRSQLSQAQIQKLGGVMSGVHRVNNVHAVDQRAMDRATPDVRDRTSLVSDEQLAGFHRTIRDATITAISNYARNVGWTSPAIPDAVREGFPNPTALEAYRAELFWADPANGPHITRLRQVFTASSTFLKTKDGEALSKRYTAAMARGGFISAEAGSVFQRELRDGVRAQVRNDFPDITIAQFDAVWSAVADPRFPLDR